MPTTTVKTIGPSGDYTTLQAWEDAAPADLVASDVIWEGQIQSGASFSGSGAQLTVSGSTTDATRYKHLTVAAGGSFADNSANVLRYNEAQGAYIKSTGGYLTCITATENYFRLSRVQVFTDDTSSNSASITGTGSRIERCIIRGKKTLLTMAGSLYNSLLESYSPGGITSPALVLNGACTVANVTVLCPGSTATAAKGIVQNYATATVTNVAIAGFGTDFDKHGPSSVTWANCFGGTSTAAYTGVTTGLAFSTATFAAVASGSLNAKLVTGSALVDAGSTVAASTPDIFGTTRTTYDVGLHELGGGDVTAPVLTSPTGTATGPTTATIGATTDEGNGSLYGVVTTSATQPSVAQIKAGQDHTGAAAVWGGSVTVSSTGAKTLNATGLTASTGYYAHLVHADAAGNNSNRISSALFTTSALPHFDLTLANRDFSTNNGTPIPSEALTFWAYNTSTGALVATITGLSTNASAIVTAPVAHASLAASTTYRLVWKFASGKVGVAELSTEA